LLLKLSEINKLAISGVIMRYREIRISLSINHSTRSAASKFRIDKDTTSV